MHAFSEPKHTLNCVTFNYSSNLFVMLELEGRFHPLDHPSLTEPVWTRWEWPLPERKQHRTAYAEILVQGLPHSYRTQWVCERERERALAKIQVWRLLIRLDNCGGGLMYSTKQVCNISWHLKRADVTGRSDVKGFSQDIIKIRQCVLQVTVHTPL